MIQEVIQQDPRPLVYKGYEQKDSPYRNQHAFRFLNLDIHFKFLSADLAEVFQILKVDKS